MLMLRSVGDEEKEMRFQQLYCLLVMNIFAAGLLCFIYTFRCKVCSGLSTQLECSTHY